MKRIRTFLIDLFSFSIDTLPEIQFRSETDHERILKNRLINMIMDNRERMNHPPLFLYKEINHK